MAAKKNLTERLKTVIFGESLEFKGLSDDVVVAYSWRAAFLWISDLARFSGSALSRTIYPAVEGKCTLGANK